MVFHDHWISASEHLFLLHTCTIAGRCDFHFLSIWLRNFVFFASLVPYCLYHLTHRNSILIAIVNCKATKWRFYNHVYYQPVHVQRVSNFHLSCLHLFLIHHKWLEKCVLYGWSHTNLFFTLDMSVVQLRSLKSDPKCKAGALNQFRLHHCMCICVGPAAFVQLKGRQGPWKLKVPGLHVGSDFTERNCSSGLEFFITGPVIAWRAVHVRNELVNFTAQNMRACMYSG